ncbi:MAG: pyridoxal phosphate-dependent aminotransferase [Clostridiales bacterium]|nr:pyridoxal phosphate-dependent aminotransferase [Clostridiales bacterium]
MLNEYALHCGKVRSEIRELFEIGRVKKQQFGEENVYDFSLGNPSVPPPKEVKDAFLDALETQSALSVHGYTTAAGSNDCRQAVAEDLQERYGEDLNFNNFYMTCGATAALVSCIRAFVTDENSEVIVIAPYFPEYRIFVEGCGAKLAVVSPDYKDFQVNFPEFEKRINANTRAIIINTPNNPSGAMYSEKTLEHMAAILSKKSREFGHPIFLISDEPYRELVYGDRRAPFIPQFYDNTVICYSYSKSLSMPGDRIGYVCVPSRVEDWEDVMAAVAGAARGAGYVCAPAIMQQVIKRCAKVRPDIAIYEANRNLLYNELTKMGYECVKPDGAFYLFVKAPNGNSQEFSRMAQDENLLIVSADQFGCPGYMRISYCVDKEMIVRSLPAFRTLMEKCK